MKTNGTTATPQIGAQGAPEQLTLLATPSVPLQFRLDERTRRSGLQHVAALRAQMVAQAASRRGTSERRHAAADKLAA